jgi:hypothetical protein
MKKNSEGKSKKSVIYKARYHYLLDHGYNSLEAQRYRTHKFDLSESGIKVLPKPNELQRPEKAVKKDIKNKPVESVRVYTKKTAKVAAPEKKLTSKEKRKIKYWIYRKLGYSSKEASKKGYGDIDFRYIKMKPDGTVPTESKVFQRVKYDVWVSKNYVRYKEKFDKVENDTVYSPWGMMTHDKRYKGETERMVNKIRIAHNLSNDQAHYFLYWMYQNNQSYERAKSELLSNRDFEMYDKIKAMRHTGKPRKAKGRIK